MARSRWLPSLLLALVQLNAVVGITFDPCKEPEAIRKVGRRILIDYMTTYRIPQLIGRCTHADR